MAWAKVWPRLSSARAPVSRCDDARLGEAARGHRLAQGLVGAAQQGGAGGFEPFEEGEIVDQPVFDHFPIAGQQLAARQGIEDRDIGQHHMRLMKAAHQILTKPRVDAGLAADRAVDLGQQGGRHLGYGDAAAQDTGGETGEIADHPAAQGDDHVAALDAGFQQGVEQALELGETLACLAGRQDYFMALDAGSIQARA